MDDREKKKEEERKDFLASLVCEYSELTGKIVRAEAQMHMVYAKRFSSLEETEVNDQLSMQIDSMKGYRQHLMRRMAMLGIDLKQVVN